MPTITQERVCGWVHCSDSACPGNEQREVDLVRERRDRTFAEWCDGSQGGAGNGLPPVPGIENTTYRVFATDPDDRECGVCGGPTEASDQLRPTYASTMKFHEGNNDPHYLLKLAARGGIHKPGTREADELAEKLAADQSDEVAELRRTVAELTGTIQGFVAGQAQRGPGRPRKTED